MKLITRAIVGAVLLGPPLAACGVKGTDLFGTGGGGGAGALPDGGEPDACPDASCACAPGEVRCVEGAHNVEERCVDVDGGAPQFQPSPCPADQVCAPQVGCGPCPGEQCAAGEIKCDGDMETVLACAVDTATGCLKFTTALGCTDAGMTSCEAPPPDFTVTDIKQYCLNECGGRGVPLGAKQCDKDPQIPCGFLVCNPATHALEPDHTACLAGGISCSKSSDCKSCSCLGGVCVGNVAASCSPACQ